MRENVLRREESGRELEAFRTGIEEWLKDLKDRDIFPNNEYRGQHESQRLAIQKLMEDGRTAIGGKLGGLDVEKLDPPLFSQECRSVDGAIVWLRRLDEHFRSRLDQRSDPRWQETLGAADEVVWSAWRLPIARHQKDVARGVASSGTSRKPGPTPLTGVQPEWSPAATPAELPLAARLRVGGELPELAHLLQRYPVSLLALPPWCAESPWWLIFIAHEIGHHLQFHLEMFGPFAKLLRDATGAQGDRWADWSAEVFADLVSVGYAGVWAVRALARIQAAQPQTMQADRKTYPPAAVRTVLMARSAVRLAEMAGKKITAAQILQGAGVENAEEIALEDPFCSVHLALVDTVLDAALTQQVLPDVAPLSQFYGPPDGALFELAPRENGRTEGARIARLAARLRTEAGPEAALLPKRLETARDLVCAGMLAWEGLLSEGDETANGAKVREDARKRLAKNIRTSLISAAPLGVRAATDRIESEEAVAVSGQVADRLLELGAEWAG